MKCIVCGKEITQSYGNPALMGAYCENCARPLNEKLSDVKLDNVDPIAIHNKIYFRAFYNLAIKYIKATHISTFTDEDGTTYIAPPEICAASIMAEEVKQAAKELGEGK